MAKEEKKYAYWLANIKGCTNRVQKRLFSVCGSAQEVYRLDKKELEKIPGLVQKDISQILDAKQSWDIDGEWQRLARQNIRFTSPEDDEYPAQFRQLPDRPYGIFYRGKLPPQAEFRVAIVGARMCSEYGRAVAREAAARLASHQIPVVSGMARGIDAAGHRGALDSGGDTYAVFGCGVDVCYPSYHKQLYCDIMQHGGLLSEYPPGKPPLACHFPQRNRLISALSDVVLIIEAKEKSGSLITADFALEQGKDVYALPGRVTDALSMGCNRLLAQGAGVFVSAEDFVAELSIEAERKKVFFSQEKEPQLLKNEERSETAAENFTKTQKIPLEKEERLVYGCLGLLPVGIEEIMAKTGLTVQTVSRVLASLQQKNQIEELFKNYYKIITI